MFYIKLQEPWGGCEVEVSLIVTPKFVCTPTEVDGCVQRFSFDLQFRSSEFSLFLQARDPSANFESLLDVAYIFGTVYESPSPVKKWRVDFPVLLYITP